MTSPATPASVTYVFGQRVRTRRLELRMSQERLAEAVGFHPTYVGRVERGERNLALQKIVRVALALDVDPADLMRGLGTEHGRLPPR